METLKLIRKNGVARITMNRPERHNAFNGTLVEELHRSFRDLAEDPETRCIVLQGAGKSFSAGADLEWMKQMASAPEAENRASAERMACLFRAVDTCPRPVVARIQGPALGGGSGLVCAVDVAIAGPQALFGFTEVRLGILPAVISPYVLRRIGPSEARHRFLTGSRFGPEEALRIGLVHVFAENLDEAVERTVAAILAGAPGAQAGIKALLRQVAGRDPEEQLRLTAEAAAASRASPEGREGMAAFLQKRRPAWSRVLETRPPSW